RNGTAIAAQGVGAAADGSGVAQVADLEPDARVAGRITDAAGGSLAALAAAADQRHVGTATGKRGGDLPADAGVRTGHDAALAVEGVCARHAAPQSGSRLPSSAASRARVSSAARHPRVGTIGSCATPISRRTISMAA